MTVNGFSIIGTPAMENLLSMPDLVVNNILPNGVTQRMGMEYIGRELIYSSSFEDGSRIRGLLHLHYIYNHRHLRQYSRIGIRIIRL